MDRRNMVVALLAPLLFVAGAAAQGDWPTKEWPVSTPSAVGLDTKALEEFDRDIAAGKYGYVDSFLVIRHGKIAYDRKYAHDYSRIYGEMASKPSALNGSDPSGPYNYYNSWWHPYYRRSDLHTMQSVTKTVTSVVIGTAVARNEFPDLNTPILKFFEGSKVANVDDRKRRITIRHLLTMTSGFAWNENLPYEDPNNSCSLMEASFDWVRFVIDRPMSDVPGAVFNYNSGATQLLSYVFRVSTGKDIEEYAAQRLFSPLGIKNYYWKRSPSGLVDTEGGLYLKPEDLARIWYLFLREGRWEAKQIVTGQWVKESTAPSVDVPGGRGSSGPVPSLIKYGYKWWLRPYGDDRSRYAWCGSGFGGQFPIAIPEYDLIAVLTGWNIVDGKPSLPASVAIDRVVRSVAVK